jgi:hypothetical protein
MRSLALTLGLALILSACAPAVAPLQEAEFVDNAVNRPIPLPPEAPIADGEVRINVRVDDPNTYNFPQLIPPDGIRPVYDPKFLPAKEVEMQENELVMGIAIDGQAKAYPVTVLRSREMVNDELAGIPILVTW